MSRSTKPSVDNSLLNGFTGIDRLREKVRIRDGHKCFLCGKQQTESKRRLDVHHMDVELEGKKGRIYKNNILISRMITLCHKCHFTRVKHRLGVE